jgi:hypothetical protein
MRRLGDVLEWFSSEWISSLTLENSAGIVAVEMRVLLAGTAVVAVLVIALVWIRGGAAKTPRQIQVSTVAGRQLKSFFDGLEPNPRRKARLDARRSVRGCRSERPGVLGKIAQAFGVERVAHAAGNCINVWCTGCYAGLVSVTCGTGCNGRYMGGFIEGDQDQGYRLYPFSPCGNDDTCPCQESTCLNGDNCGL